MRNNLDEATLRVYDVLLEKFGDPIGEVPTTTGVPDDRDELKETKKGMTKKGAKSFIKGTKKFSDKVTKAKKAGMKNPEGFAAWTMHKATGKWPNEK